jgi:hypothetical protein
VRDGVGRRDFRSRVGLEWKLFNWARNALMFAEGLVGMGWRVLPAEKRELGGGLIEGMAVVSFDCPMYG